MKIISNDVGRAQQSFVADEVNPPGGLYLGGAIRLISERYSFGLTPSIEDAQVKGAVFKNGRLVSGSQTTNIQEIGVLNDAVYATAQNTTMADFVLDDLFTWAEHAIGLRPPITKIPRRYGNAAVVEFEANFDGRLNFFDELINSYSGMLTSLYDEDVSVSIHQFGFAVDSSGVKTAINSNFTVERRIGMPFSSNRFFCIAPLKTEMHIELLEKFERIFI